METKQLEAVAGLLAGMELAVAHLARLLAQQQGINPDQIAASFDATAEAIPAEVGARGYMQVALRQVAAGIRHAQSSDAVDVYRRTLN